MKVPRRKQVRDATFKLLLENGAEGWRVRFNPRLSRALGRCIPSQKVIEYQPRYMEQNDWAQVFTTIQHEVAHALTPRHHHDATWAAMARKLGLSNPSAINRTAIIKAKFTATCPNVDCDREIQRDRRSGLSCGRCSGRLYNPAYKMIWSRNV